MCFGSTHDHDDLDIEDTYDDFTFKFTAGEQRVVTHDQVFYLTDDNVEIRLKGTVVKLVEKTDFLGEPAWIASVDGGPNDLILLESELGDTVGGTEATA